MRSHKQDQAAGSVIVPKGGIRGNESTQKGGLMGRESIASAVSCAIAKCRAMLCLPSRLTGGRLGGLRVQRRFIATSRYARGFSLCAQQRTCVYAVKVRCPPEQGKD